MAKPKKWIKFRHYAVRNLLGFPLYLYSRWKYGITIERFAAQEKRPYLILLNHQTAFDQFFVGLAFRGPVYYVASEDLFSNGFVSSLIRWLVAPIPIKKQTTDVAAVRNCLRVAREGGSIAIAPEGNRTYSGKTEYMNPAIATLAKKLGMPIAFYRLEGGYGVQPRWSDVIRRGKMRGYVSRVISPEEYAALTPDELLQEIEKELFVNEAVSDGEFHHKNLAEYLERAIYVCPYCGLSRFISNGDTITCCLCHRKVRYLPNKQLEGVGFEFPFRFVADWYEHQCDVVNMLDTTAYTAEPLYRDCARLSQVILYKRKELLREWANVALYGDRIVIDEGERDQLTFPFSEISAVTVLGRNKLNIYVNGELYQLKSDKRFNALKYVNIFYRSKNLSKEETANVKFLGL